MRAYQCDRCKTLYTDETNEQRNCQKQYYSICVCNEDAPDCVYKVKDGRILDLCPDCFKELQEWMPKVEEPKKIKRRRKS